MSAAGGKQHREKKRKKFVFFFPSSVMKYVIRCFKNKDNLSSGILVYSLMVLGCTFFGGEGERWGRRLEYVAWLMSRGA